MIRLILLAALSLVSVSGAVTVGGTPWNLRVFTNVTDMVLRGSPLEINKLAVTMGATNAADGHGAFYLSTATASTNADNLIYSGTPGYSWLKVQFGSFRTNFTSGQYYGTDSSGNLGSFDLPVAAGLVTFNSDQFTTDAGGAKAIKDGAIVTNLTLSVSGGPQRTIEERYQEVINVVDRGAVGDGSTDNALVLQTCFNEAAVNPGRKIVYFPSGDFGTSSNLVATNTIIIQGAGKELSKIRALTTNNIINFGTLGTSIERCEVRDIQLLGNSMAVYGIYSPNIDHAIFFRVRITGTETIGAYLNYGWNNAFIDCELSNNNGDALKLGVVGGSGGNNAFWMVNNKVFLNAGIGADIQSGYQLNFLGNTFEHNERVDIYARYGITGLNIIGNYFENGGSVGKIFNTPSETVHAAIIINGMTDFVTQGHDFHCKAVNIEGNFFSASTNHTAFVRLNGVDGASIRNNVLNEAPVVPLVEIQANSDYGEQRNVTIENNTGFSTQQPTLVNATATKPVQLSTWNISGIQARNYLTLNPFDYLPSGTNVFTTRAQETYNGRDVIYLNSFSSIGVGEGSDVAVVQINLDSFPWLTNRVVYIHAKARSLATNMNATAYISGIGESSDSYVLTTNWTEIEMQRALPSSGEISFGFRKLDGGTNGILIAEPVLSLVGVSKDRYWREHHRVEYRHTMAPTNGYWLHGQIVWNKAPEVGTATGWVSTEEGFDAGFIPIGQPNNANLSAISALASGAGFYARIASDTAELRELTGDSEIIVTDGDGVAGDPTFSLDASITRDVELISGLSGKQDLDSDLTDLADGSLTGSKVGSGINGDNITSGTVDEARIDADIARDSEVTSAVATKQDSDSDLTAVAGLSTTGIMVRTGSGTATTRTITGDSEIVVSNGSGVSGNPTLSIDSSIARDSEVTAAVSAKSDPITVQEEDGSPSVANVTTIRFANGTVTDNGGGSVSVANGGGGGGLSTRTGVYRELWIPASQFHGASVNGASSNIYTLSSGAATIQIYEFGDSATENVSFFWAPPDSWDAGTVKIKIYWTANTGTASEGVVWLIGSQTGGDGDAVPTVPGGTTLSDSYQGSDLVHITSAFTLSLTSPAVGDVIHIRIGRQPSNMGDTKSGAALMLGVKIQYLESETEPSAW